MRVVVGAESSFRFSARDADNNKITDLLRRGGRLLVAARDFNALVDPANYSFESSPTIADTTGPNVTADDFTVSFTPSRAGEFTVSVLLASTGFVCRAPARTQNGFPRKRIVTIEAVCQNGTVAAAVANVGGSGASGASVPPGK